MDKRIEDENGEQADRLGNLPNQELVTHTVIDGLALNVYMSQCEGLAVNSEEGWYHVGVDFIEVATDKAIETIMIDEGSDEDRPGHYTRDNAIAKAAEIILHYQSIWAKTQERAERAHLPAAGAYLAAFKRSVEMRRAEEKIVRSLLDSLFAGFLGNMAEVEGQDSTTDLMGLSDDLDTNSYADQAFKKVMGDFDPFKAGPTNEGLPEDEK